MKKCTSTGRMIDHRVFVAMLMFMLIGMLTFSFRYKNFRPYVPLKLVISADTIFTGSLTGFTAVGNDAQKRKLLWWFGDGSTTTGKGKTAYHQYARQGRYIITLLVDDRFREYKTIYVQDRKASPVLASVQIEAPDTAYVGDTVLFRSICEDATQWSWSFSDRSEYPEFDASNISHVFDLPGKKQVFLLVDGGRAATDSIIVKSKPRKPVTMPPAHGDRNRGTIDVGPTHLPLQVKEVPPVIPEPATVTRKLDEKELESILRKMVSNQAGTQDLIPFVAKDLKVIINYVDKRDPPPVALDQLKNELLEYFKRTSKIKKLTVHDIRRNADQSIKQFTIKADRRFIVL